MKLTMGKFYDLCATIEIMRNTPVAGMAKYVWDLDNAITTDRQFYVQELKKIEAKYGKIDEESEEAKELMKAETNDLPELSREKIELLDKYPLLPVQYGLMLELVKEDKNDGESNNS